MFVNVHIYTHESQLPTGSIRRCPQTTTAKPNLGTMPESGDRVSRGRCCWGKKMRIAF